MSSSEFAAPRWLTSAHLQTLGAAVPLFSPPRSHADQPAEPMRIPLDERHRLHAHAWWKSETERRPVVIVVHGIGGSSAAPYVVRAAVALHRAGYSVVRLDMRGAGQSMTDAPSLYHGGLSADLGRVVDFVAKDRRAGDVALMGFSGGGAMSLKLAGEWAERPPESVRAVVSISAPLDYAKVGAWMDSLRRFPYRYHVLRRLSEDARAFARLHPERAHYRPEDVRKPTSFRDYDSRVLVPMHGFPDVDTYHRVSSAGPLLGQIRVPTLLMHAEDDPMVPSWSVRPWLSAASSSVTVVTSQHGGHLGWVSGLDEQSWVMGWPTRRALAFLDEAMGKPRVVKSPSAP